MSAACSASSGWPDRRRSARAGAGRSPTACTSRPPTAGGPSPTPCARRSTSSTSAARWPASPSWRPPRFHFTLPGLGPGLRRRPRGRRAGGRRHRQSAPFVPREAFALTRYELQACPTLYPGQTVRAEVEGAPARLLVRGSTSGDELVTCADPRACSSGGSPTPAGGRSPRWASRPTGPARLGLADLGRRAGGVRWAGRPAGRVARAWVGGVDRWDDHLAGAVPADPGPRHRVAHPGDWRE